MLELIFIVLMIAVFGRLAIFAFKMAWGITKVVVTLVFLPLILISGLFAGLVRFALPVLVIVGLVSLFTERKE